MEPPRPRSEITAMCFLRLSNLVATGHEAGEVMLWYTEINSHLLLKADRNAQHSNTVTAMT